MKHTVNELKKNNTETDHQRNPEDQGIKILPAEICVQGSHIFRSAVSVY